MGIIILSRKLGIIILSEGFIMNKDEILARSRQENRDRDLFEMSVDRSAGRVGVVVMYAVVLILTVINVIQTGKLDIMLWIVAFTVDTSMEIYKAVKLKTRKSITSAIALVIADIASSVFFFHELFIK